MSGQKPKFQLYHYVPNVVPAGIFCGIFLVSAIIHVFQVVRTKTWFFIPFIAGALMESIGFAVRIVSHNDISAMGPFIVQSVLILLAPAVFAAAIYILLGRIIVLTNGEEHSVIRVRILTKLFVFGDWLSIMIQGNAAGLLPSKNKTVREVAKYVVLGGIAVQILFFGFFIVVLFVFHRRMVQKPTDASITHAKQARVSWKTMIWVIYATSILIMIRSIFRLIEYVQGNDGNLMKNEIWLYLFDATLMVPVSFLFNWYHPSKMVVGRDENIGMSRLQEEGEVETTTGHPGRV